MHSKDNTMYNKIMFILDIIPSIHIIEYNKSRFVNDVYFFTLNMA